ncbi:hypothetical protein E6R18_15720 [Streptomyces sp. A1277]|uniref:hypothetical protein n=1 Tax=Streptomyces sp. A1277 TaxID=2563103 RepID=UPI0010A24534|nr:hypothetical protein [Streptomyces sp. A1277]THA31780.1 hypothetical protein E6R18_15720 [Streptomyces sp. A1277]
MSETPAKTYPCCAIPLFILLVLVIAGSCSASLDGTDDAPAPTRPTLRDPGYTDSLCEGGDYALYDDCR